MISSKGYFDSVFGNCMLMCKLAGVVSAITKLNYSTTLPSSISITYRCVWLPRNCFLCFLGKQINNIQRKEN